jgi:hypothetical protein
MVYVVLGVVSRKSNEMEPRPIDACFYEFPLPFEEDETVTTLGMDGL